MRPLQVVVRHLLVIGRAKISDDIVGIYKTKTTTVFVVYAVVRNKVGIPRTQRIDTSASGKVYVVVYRPVISSLSQEKPLFRLLSKLRNDDTRISVLHDGEKTERNDKRNGYILHNKVRRPYDDFFTAFALDKLCFG